MNKVILIAISFFGINSFAQDLNCNDFKNGEFLIPADSLNPSSFKVIRENNQQIEIDEFGGEGLIDIEYIDDCNYILTSNPESKGLDKIAKKLNSTGGVKVEVTDIKGDTLFYNSYMLFENKLLKIPGKLIKLK